MTHQELSSLLRTRVYFWAAIVTAILALFGFLSAHKDQGLLALIFSLLLAANYLRQQAQAEESDKPNTGTSQPTLLAHIIILFLGSITLASTTLFQGFAETWSYIFPLLIFMIYPLRIATYGIAVYSLIFSILMSQIYVGPLKSQILINYLLCLGLTGCFVWLREIRERQIKPLRKTDNLTLASTQEYLHNDLEKEIQRSEREGSGLALLAIALDSRSLKQVNSEDRDTLLNRLGRTLHQTLRPFDSYYRWQDAIFLVVLPHTSSKQSIKTAEQLRLRLKENLSSPQRKITASIGVSTLNVGDTAESMIEQATQALNLAQKQGANRSQSWIESKPAEDSL